MAEQVESHIHDLALTYLGSNGIPTLSSGFPILDRALDGGFVPGSIYVLGGFPGSGKTSFALSIARRMAFEGKRRVLYVSLEMSATELLERALCQFTRQTVHQLRELRSQHHLNDAAEPFVTCCKQSSFKIEDVLGDTTTDLQVLIEGSGSADEHPPEVLIIDHLQHQLFTEGLSRADALANYMADLKKLAKRHRLVILACSQFNRVSRNEKKAQLWHLKSSGAIEEVSDCVLLCDKANLDTLDLKTQQEPTEFTVRVAKHRRGPLSEFTLIFTPAHYEFEEPASTWQPTRKVVAEDVLVIEEEKDAHVQP